MAHTMQPCRREVAPAKTSRWRVLSWGFQASPAECPGTLSREEKASWDWRFRERCVFSALPSLDNRGTWAKMLGPRSAKTRRGSQKRGLRTQSAQSVHDEVDPEQLQDVEGGLPAGDGRDEG